MILCTKWEDLQSQDFLAISSGGYFHPEHQRRFFSHDQTYESCLLMAVCQGEEDLKHTLRSIFADAQRFGAVLRIKGFVRGANRQWYMVNATPQMALVEPSDISRGLCIVIGHGLKEPMLKDMLSPGR